MLIIAFAIAYWLRFDVQVTVAPEIVPSIGFYSRLIVLLLPMWLGLFFLSHLYDYQTLLGGTEEYVRAINACSSGMMLVVLASFIEPFFVVSRAWLIFAWLFSILLVCTARFVLRRVAYRLRDEGFFVSPALIVGTNGEADALADALAHTRSSGMAIVGLVESTPSQAVPHTVRDGLEVVGGIPDLRELVERYQVEEVVIATSGLDHGQMMTLFEQMAPLKHVDMRLSSGFVEVLSTDARVTRRGGITMVTLNRLRLDRVETVIKRSFDLLASSIALFSLAPLMLALMVLIRLDSPGAAIYRRRVLGLGGREFDAFKFRTMRVDGDALLAADPELMAAYRQGFKLREDPRVTRVGRWLRRYSLDELPQLINVFLGQMSLVGPRMITTEEAAAKYGRQRYNLLTVKPGLTGLWQVSGRSNLTYEERVEMDMEYIRNYSIWRDLQILVVETIPAVLKGTGAY